MMHNCFLLEKLKKKVIESIIDLSPKLTKYRAQLLMVVTFVDSVIFLNTSRDVLVVKYSVDAVGGLEDPPFIKIS